MPCSCKKPKCEQIKINPKRVESGNLLSVHLDTMY